MIISLNDSSRPTEILPATANAKPLAASFNRQAGRWV